MAQGIKKTTGVSFDLLRFGSVQSEMGTDLASVFSQALSCVSLGLSAVRDLLHAYPSLPVLSGTGACLIVGHCCDNSRHR